MFTAYNLQQLTTTYNNLQQPRTLFIGTEPCLPLINQPQISIWCFLNRQCWLKTQALAG